MADIQETQLGARALHTRDEQFNGDHLHIRKCVCNSTFVSTSLAQQFGMDEEPHKVCLIPVSADETDGLAIIVTVELVDSNTLILGAWPAGEFSTTFSWKGVAAAGPFSGYRIPPTELDRIEDFATQGTYA